MIFQNFRKNVQISSQVFENLRKFSENFGNGSKVIFRCFYEFLKFSNPLMTNFHHSAAIVFEFFHKNALRIFIIIIIIIIIFIIIIIIIIIIVPLCFRSSGGTETATPQYLNG